MTISAYTGLPGSGKSYQVVSHVILGALREGRRVVTNIEGLKEDLIAKILEEEDKIHLDYQGQLLLVTNEQVNKENFYYQPYSDSIIQPGDVLILDECWYWFEDGIAIPERTMQFFRMHRHYVNDNNVTCDIVLLSQDIMDIGRKTRRVIEQTFLMSKLTEVGMETSFRIDIFTRTNLRRAPLRSEYGTYRKKYFELYDSYTFGTKSKLSANRKGAENRVDKRGNIWRSPMLRYGLPLSVVGLGFCIWFIIGYFNPEKFSNDKKKIAPPPPVSPIAVVSPQNVVNNQDGLVDKQNSQVNAVAQNKANTPLVNSEPKESSSINVAGYYKVKDKLYVVLRSSDKQRVIVEPKDFNVQDILRIEGKFQGEIVNTYTGSGIKITPQGTGKPNDSGQPKTIDIIPAGAKPVVNQTSNNLN